MPINCLWCISMNGDWTEAQEGWHEISQTHNVCKHNQLVPIIMWLRIYDAGSNTYMLYVKYSLTIAGEFIVIKHVFVRVMDNVLLYN